MAKPDRVERARISLDGLSVGDAFGQQFFGTGAHRLAQRTLTPEPWRWTDDTAMAVSILEVLSDRGRIDQDRLARAFAKRWSEAPNRGYGPGAFRILEAILHGAPWWSVSRQAFGREGSKGNGGAMRVAPLGAWFADDLDALVIEAARSAEVTHGHLEGQAGAIAVALATALAVNGLRGNELLDAVRGRVPEGQTREGLARAATLGAEAHATEAAELLGAGEQILAEDTVPFALWCAAHHLDDFVEAMWVTVSGLGDRDTTCAIAGGVVAAAGAEIPRQWLSAREPLPVLAVRGDQDVRVDRDQGAGGTA